MSELADRIRAAREQWVSAGGNEWLVRRPTRLQLLELAGAPREVVFISVVDWKISECDLVPGGGGRVLPFDAEAFREYASDQQELITELAQHVSRIINAHAEAKERVEKN
jgi:hypothetical protein